MPELNRIVTTNFDMRGADDGRHIQIWNLETLELLTTLAVPETSLLQVHLNPFEGRLLSDGTTIMFQTYSCGLYVLTDIETHHPKTSFVHNFAEERYCSLPVRLGNYWVQTVDDQNGDLQEVAVLDVTNPNNPKKVGAIAFDSDFSPHWLSPDATGTKIVLTGYGKELSRRIIMLDFDPSTGDLTIDETFGDGDERGPGVIFHNSLTESQITRICQQQRRHFNRHKLKHLVRSVLFNATKFFSDFNRIRFLLEQRLRKHNSL